jgi:hypothetical protein
MKKIFKYSFGTSSNLQTITMPEGAEILSVQIQRGAVCVWVVVPNVEKALVERHFAIFGTGQPINPDLKLCYVGTFQEGDFVWHVFEISATQ